MDAEKVAIVTAGGGGIGRAVSKELYRQGYQLALMSRSDACENLAQEFGGVGLLGRKTLILLDTIQCFYFHLKIP